MDIGALNSRVTIKVPLTAQDDHGQPNAGFTDLATVWADIRYLRGFEAIKAGASTSTVSTSIRVRYRTDITAGMQVWHGNVKYNINAVLPDMQGKERVDLLCEVL